MPRPSFATPLPQSPRSDILEWRLPRPFHQYVLTGRSRAAWHTSFIIPQLNLLLDAGLVINNMRPKHVFLTHGHSDHTLLIPVYAIREDPPDIYCPEQMRRTLNDYLLARTMLNLGGEVDVDDAEAQGLDTADPAIHVNADGQRSNSELAWLNTHACHGLQPGDEVPLRRLKGSVTARAFACDHTVPSLGYVFSTSTQRLKPEYAGRPGQELKALRESGTPITATQTTHMLAFLGDTTAATLAADPAWLREGVAVVITECSFLYEEHRAQAERTKHTLWRDLEPVVRRWPKTTFVLTHFSLRYSEAQIVAFFQDMVDPPSNIVVWADGEAGLDAKPGT
ncbi:beta-lactamase-like protein [Stachybotrys elegans]|uniref:Beta-lactamase-like protein n=1 Tax=Stachybotrys elegans TaxID=80388 RepID=A0A8K0SJX8_9HYPO|nr:beta-lactamase-like protein [Stachybotrys elegans]